MASLSPLCRRSLPTRPRWVARLCRLWRSPKHHCWAAHVCTLWRSQKLSVCMCMFFRHSREFRRCYKLYCARRCAFVYKHLVARRERAQRRLKYSTSAAKFKTLTHASVTACTNAPPCGDGQASVITCTNAPPCGGGQASATACTNAPPCGGGFCATAALAPSCRTAMLVNSTLESAVSDPCDWSVWAWTM